MSRRIASVAVAAVLTLVACAALAGSASAAFGLKELDSTFTRRDGTADTQAGSHPFAQTVTLAFNTNPLTHSFTTEVPDGDAKDVVVSLPPGFVGAPSAVAACSGTDFIEERCQATTRVGRANVIVGGPEEHTNTPVYSLEPPPGVAMRLGFVVLTVPVIIDLEVNPDPPYNVIANVSNTSNELPIYRSEITIWGVPGSPDHDAERGCTGGVCPTMAEKPFLTLPSACQGPLPTLFKADSWQDPGAWNEPPPVLTPGMSGCSRLGFSPTIGAVPTSKAAQSPTGLDFSLDVENEGLVNPSEEAVSQSDIEKTEVTLPEGFSINPSIAEGLSACTEADLARESASSEPGAGCPNASKIGTVEVETPLLDESVDGALYQATPYENPFHNLITLYVVIKNPTLGIKIVQPLRVENNLATGQITTVAEEMPQLPFSHFRLHFREGTRSPLATPPLCGKYAVSAKLYPYSGGAPITTTGPFEVITGTNAGPCPSGGTPPFHPGLEAGTVNNAAGAYSPFYVHLTRKDGEQEITHFSIKLPPGVVGKLAGIPFCSDGAIAAAAARTGPHGGQEEIEHPSCPAASEVGHTLVGVGVGPSLAYAPGKVYLAGPYHGSALSIVAITAAKVGPFDLGTVVVREALKVNPETAEVFVDATGSDPLPHIIKGIPVHLRDIRVYVDRPEFVLNPTSCERTSTASTVLGSGTDFASESDDQPITVTSPFQAASCASLPFQPKLAISLKGGITRSANPALTAVVTARKGDANIGRARVTLPHSEFLEQGHIKTVCTRVQFAAGGGNGEQCPAASVYGRAKATTPLLSEPLSGPVFLRSSSHRLPDLVAALHGSEINIDLDGRIDSAKGGRIRTNFESVPDAPVTKFTLEMFGGKKSLLANSTNICKGTHNAISEFTGQNGKLYNTGPPVKAQCGKKGKKGKKGKTAAKKGSKSSRADAGPARLVSLVRW